MSTAERAETRLNSRKKKRIWEVPLSPVVSKKRPLATCSTFFPLLSCCLPWWALIGWLVPSLRTMVEERWDEQRGWEDREGQGDGRRSAAVLCIFLLSTLHPLSLGNTSGPPNCVCAPIFHVSGWSLPFPMWIALPITSHLDPSPQLIKAAL